MQHIQKTKQNILKYRYQLSIWAFALIGIFVVWNTFVTINRNYQLQTRVNELNSQIANLEIENENLQLQNNYLETDEYLESEARRQLGLARPGETVYLEPNAVLDDLRAAPQSYPGQTTSINQTGQSGWRHNLSEWRLFLFNS